MASETGSEKRPVTASDIVARIERLPYSSWHVWLRFVVGAAFFFDSVDNVALQSVLPALVPLWKIPPTKIGMVISMSFVGNALGALLCGLLAERYGRMKIMMVTVGIYSAASFACALAWNYNSLVLFRTIQGFGLGGEIPIGAAFINEWAKARGRGRFFLIYNLAYLFGAVGGSYLASWVVPTLGWRWMFYIGAFPAVLIGLLRYTIPESPRWLAGRGRLKEADAILTRLEEKISKGGRVPLPPVVPVAPPAAEKKTSFPELFKGIYRQRTIVLWIISFGGAFLNLGLTAWLPTLYRTVFHLPLRTSILYGTYTLLAVLVSNFMSPFFVDKTGRKGWYAGSWLIGSIPYFIVWATHPATAHGLLAFVLVATLFLASPMGVTTLYMVEIYPTRMRALGSSVSRIFYALATIVSPMLIGLIVSGYGIYNIFSMFAIVAFVLGLVAVFFVVETRGRVLEEVSA